MATLGDMTTTVTIDASDLTRRLAEMGLTTESMRALVRAEVARQLKDIKLLTIEELERELRVRTGVRKAHE